MDTPDREARSLPHNLTEVNQTTVGKVWQCHVHTPVQWGSSIVGEGKTIAEATADAAAKLKEKHPGYTL